MADALAAAIHVLTGGKDYSNGALQEHGRFFFVPGNIMYNEQQKNGYTWLSGAEFDGDYSPTSHPAHEGSTSNGHKYVITASYDGNIYATFSDKYKKK